MLNGQICHFSDIFNGFCFSLNFMANPCGLTCYKLFNYESVKNNEKWQLFLMVDVKLLEIFSPSNRYSSKAFLSSDFPSSYIFFTTKKIMFNKIQSARRYTQEQNYHIQFFLYFANEFLKLSFYTFFIKYKKYIFNQFFST